MADEEQSAFGVIPGLVQEYAAQLWATTERLADLGRSGGRPPSVPGALALPGAFSAAQLTLVADSIAAQRQSIAVLKAQLSAFDEQLALLEQMLAPLTEWSRNWADLEQRLLNMGPRPQAGGPAGS